MKRWHNKTLGHNWIVSSTIVLIKMEVRLWENLSPGLLRSAVDILIIRIISMFVRLAIFFYRDI